MAIRGAFAAGLLDGFATGLTEGVEKRQDRFDVLFDESLESAKRLAPKYAKSKAEADAAVEMMNAFGKEYNITPEEFISMAQTYDVTQIYAAVAEAEAKMPEGATLDKAKILGPLNIPSNIELPEGMSNEQAVRSIFMGYANNMAEDPTDKSEAKANTSWGKALANTLMINPRNQADDMLNAMSVMGVPYKDLMLYQASAGERYKPLAGVSGKPIYNIDITDYQDADYDRTANTFRVHFTRKFTGTEDISLANATTMEEVKAAMGVDNAEQLDGSLMMGGNTMADIELRLATTYGHESSRVRIAALNKLTTYIETAADFKAFKEAEKDGNASRLISESINKHGVLTTEYINMILGNDAELPEGKKTEGGSSVSNESLNISGEMDGEDDPSEELSGTIPTTSEANDDLLNTGGDANVSEVDEMIDAVIANETGEDNSINLGTPNVSEVTERRIDKVDAYREAASKITYEEYQQMSRSEAKEAGLPATGFESAEAFGFFPKKYFKGGAEEIDLGIDKTSTDSSTVAGAAVKVANELADEFTDMSVFLEIDDRGRPDDTILKDWLDQNNVPANEQMIRMIRTMIKARQKNLKENPASELDE